MGLLRMYVGYRQKKVRVIEPHGRIRHLDAPIIIRDLLLQYPDAHTYCVRHVSGSILSMDAVLQGGNTYMILAAQPKKPECMSKPCDRGRCSKAAWKPSLDIIFENDTPLHSKNKPQAMKKEKNKVFKSIQIKSNNSWNRTAWQRENEMGLAYMQPRGILF